MEFHKLDLSAFGCPSTEAYVEFEAFLRSIGCQMVGSKDGFIIAFRIGTQDLKLASYLTPAPGVDRSWFSGWYGTPKTNEMICRAFERIFACNTKVSFESDFPVPANIKDAE